VAGVSVHECGILLLIVEVAGRSTVAGDVGSKRALYEFVGVAEYIVFDAAGGVLSPPLRAWRAVDGRYVPWLAEPDGWWHSRALDITLRPTQPFMTIRDRDGREISTSRRALEREERLEQELAEARRRIASLEADRDRRTPDA
jgi:hypothetical protein